MPWITREGRTVEEAQDAAVNAAGVPASELEIEVVSEGAKGLFGLGGEPAVVRVRPKGEASDVRSAFRDDATHGVEERVGTEAAEVEPPEADEARPEAAEVERPEADEARPEAGPSPDEDEEEAEANEQQEEAIRVGVEMLDGILERMGVDGEVKPRVAGGTVYLEVFGDEMGILIGRSGATLEALQELVRAGVQRRLQSRQPIVVDVEAYWERRRKGRKRSDGGDGRGRRRGGRGAGRGRRGEETDRRS